MATLYVEVGFVSLHQKAPADYRSSGGPTLSIGGVTTSISRYSLEVGRGDPGENPYYEGFDYSEFSIVGASFTRPSNFGERLTYSTESGSSSVSKYRVVTVPDGFQIPGTVPNIGGTGSFGDPSSFFNSSDGGSFDFQWSVFYASGSPVTARTAVSEAISELLDDGLTRVFGSSIASAIQNAQSARSAVESVFTQNVELLQFGIENFDGLSPERYRAAMDRTIAESQQILVNELANQLRAHFPGPPPAVLELPGYRVTAGVDWARAAAEIIVGETILSVTDIRSIRSGPNVDHQGTVHYGIDTYYRSEGSDLIISNDPRGVAIDALRGDDVIITGSGNDRIVSGGGNDRIDAGGGNLDIVQFTSGSANYSIVPRLDNTVLVHHFGFSEGDDLIRGVERLQFADGIVALDVQGNAGQVYRLYQAAFGRTPDTHGLSSNVHLVDTSLNLNQMSAAFAISEEFQLLYGSNTTDLQYVTALYMNVLHRAPDPAGLAGWLENLFTGRSSRADVLIGFSESTENHFYVDPIIAQGIVMDRSALL